MPFYDDRGTDFTMQSYSQTAWAPPGLHIHPQNEMMVILDNSKARISISGKVYYPKQPFIVFFSPFSLHQVSFLGVPGGDRFLYYFNDNVMDAHPEEFENFLSYRSSTAVIFLLPESLVDKLRPLHRAALENCENVLLSKLLFMTTLNMLLNEKEDCSLITANDQMSHFVPVIRYMTEHFHENITADSVAQTFFMSRAKLNRNFREYAKVSFHQFLSELRVNKAQFMLKQNYTIHEIANSVGFENVSYFCQFFKKMKGITPLQFAKKHSFSRSNKQTLKISDT